MVTDDEMLNCEANHEETEVNQDSTQIVVSCKCSEHNGIDLINRDFHCSVDYLHQVLFTDSELLKKSWAFRKIDKMQLSEWLDNKMKMSYSLSLGVFGSARNSEELVILRRQDTNMIVTESQCVTSGALYCEYFYVTTRFCITKIGPNKSHLLVKFVINFKKQPMSFIKAIIEKNAERIAKDCFAYLEKLLIEEDNKWKASPPTCPIAYPYLKYSSPKIPPTLPCRTSPAIISISNIKPSISPISQQDTESVRDSIVTETEEEDGLIIEREEHVESRVLEVDSLSKTNDHILDERLSHPSTLRRQKHTKKSYFVRINSRLVTQFLVVMLMVILVFNAKIYLKLRKAEHQAIALTEFKQKLMAQNYRQSACKVDQVASYNDLTSLRAALSDTIKKMQQIEIKLQEYEKSSNTSQHKMLEVNAF